MNRWMQAVTALATSTLLAACGGGGGGLNPDVASANVDQTLRSSGMTDTMAQAAAASGLSATLQGNRNLTLLMPSDEAMAPFAEELADLARPENREALQTYVKAHIVDGTLLAEAISTSAVDAQAATASKDSPASTQRPQAITVTIKNLLGDDLEIVVDGGVVTVNGAAFLDKDLKASNGVLHIFNAPLFRPSIFGIVRTLPQTSILEAAVRAAGLTDALRARGSLTLFAPTNAAFASLLVELKLTPEQLLGNKPLLTQVLTYHVLASRVLAGEIDDGATPTTLQGQSIEFDVSGERYKRRVIEITDARDRKSKVVLANLRAANGVVHLVDRVILPTDKNIVEIASGNPQFSILVEAVVAAGLAEALSGPGPSTVFAPTNTAFAALLVELGLTKEELLANKPLLTQVLTYHALSARVLANDIGNGLAVETLEGQPIKFTSNTSGVSIADARGRTSNVIVTNVQASNGVVHAIDKVILPTDKNIVEIASGNPQFSILVEAVIAADLAGALSGPGPFTVFAPTNAAFVALLLELGITKDQLLSNKALLTKVLTYHVLATQVLSSGIPFGAPITTVQGQSFRIGTDLKITDQLGRKSNIVATDVAASNGVVHVIDRVILPK